MRARATVVRVKVNSRGGGRPHVTAAVDMGSVLADRRVKRAAVQVEIWRFAWTCDVEVCCCALS